MFVRELETPIYNVRGAGKQTTEALARLGIGNIGALLTYYPKNWEDRSTFVALRDWNQGRAVYTIATVLAHEWFGYPKQTLKVHIEDETGRAELICFNRPFLEKTLVPGHRYLVWGTFSYRYGSLQSSSFEIEPADQITEKQTFPFLPVYALTTGLTQKTLRRLVYQALHYYGKNIEEELPLRLRTEHGLLSKPQALYEIHFPHSAEALQQAQKTIKYEELFYLEVMVGRRCLERKQNRIARTGSLHTKGTTATPPEINEQSFEDNQNSPGLPAHSVVFDPQSPAFSPLQQRLAERLPFTLTPGQQRAIEEINADMAGPSAMARLLQGDVGSGKTLVSFMAALAAIEGGGQAALMAPTELLARQHAENASRLLEPLGISVAFLTGNIKAAGRQHLLRALAAGEVQFVIGTHALFSRDVRYHRLKLVIIDEQHRFGVLQRAAILAKGEYPHLLMMSATPIPRTLALTVFGDMDVTVIRDMPLGRKPVKTHLACQTNERRVYDFVRKELVQGHQAYFVYPLIEGDSDNGTQGNLKTAQAMAVRLQREIYPEYRVALVHSRLDEEEKRKTMEAFRRADIQILVATSVVEVGVDVPNATCMVIEHAERFGLSALHQLRGRVGRGKDQAYCFLVYSHNLT
ncbi:MAG: ATP-dependent DNA helicase RecG, partial [Termitinemataceae bacterium]